MEIFALVTIFYIVYMLILKGFNGLFCQIFASERGFILDPLLFPTPESLIQLNSNNH